MLQLEVQPHQLWVASRVDVFTLKAGSQYDDRVSFRSFRIVPFGRLTFELFINYRSLVPFPSLQFTLC